MWSIFLSIGFSQKLHDAAQGLGDATQRGDINEVARLLKSESLVNVINKVSHIKICIMTICSNVSIIQLQCTFRSKGGL